MEPDVSTSRIPNIKQALLSAIEQQKIDLVYQGQNELPSRQLVGVEALCRIAPGPWGEFTPDQFIPVAENVGLIAPLERLVFAQLARDLPHLLQSPIKPVCRLSAFHQMNRNAMVEAAHAWHGPLRAWR